MSALSLRSVPSTPLDDLRVLLSSRPEEDPAFQPRLLQALGKLRHLALAEVEERLLKPTTPKPLKRAILEAIPRVDWPDWVPILARLLEKEVDLSLFDRGCAALGAIGNRAALHALQHLRSLRGDADRQLILNRELEPFTPIQTAEVYLARLAEGQNNTRLATVAGKVLAGTATVDHLPQLTALLRREDPLTRHWALRIVDSLEDPSVMPMVIAIFLESAQECRETRLLFDLLERSQVISRTQVRDEMIELLGTRLVGRVPEPWNDLRAALNLAGGDTAAMAEALHDHVIGPYEAHLLEGIALLVDNKVARFNGLLSERLDQSRRTLELFSSTVDATAEALLRHAQAGQMPLERLIPPFTEAVHLGAGGDGLLISYARLIPPTAQTELDAALADPDIDRRRRFLEAVGSREEDAFVPFFLKALGDPIIEVGTLAMHHLGRLPSSFPVLLAGFQANQTDKVRVAIRVWGENHTQAALDPLLAFIPVDQRDELVVEAVEALENLRDPRSTGPMLDLLHDGKPKSLQLALARALGALHTPEASLGLLDKAPHLKIPQVLILALEGALAAFPSFRKPFPADRLSDLQALVLRCCDEREGEGQRERAILSLRELYAFDPGIYEYLKDRLSIFLAELRSQEAWDKDRTEALSAVIRELTRRNASLAQITEKEQGLRTQLQEMPAQGSQRAEALLQLRETLKDPELLLRPEFGEELHAFVREGFARAGEWREVAHLCQIAGLLGNPDLVDTIRDIYLRATGIGLRAAAKEALLALGLTEADLQRRQPIRTVLVLEPSAFFQKRLTAALEASGRSVRGAAQRGEAELALAASPVDLVISERDDGGGDLTEWLQTQWHQGRFRYLLVSANRRDPHGLDGAWVVGTLHKPYPLEQLVQSLEP